jgi:spermidine synthase
MIPWTEVSRASVPGEARPIVLARRAEEFVIRVGHTPLMSSRMHDSEDELATHACAPLAASAAARVLVGGLGMGFTLAAALKVLPASARLVVAELVPAIVEWNRGPLAALAGRPLEDERVTVHVGNVSELLAASDAAFDAILLDVDNGPAGLTRSSNEQLYSAAGLRTAARALRKGGVLAVWSVAPDERFAHRLADAGFAVEELAVRAHAGKGTRHVLWFARRPARA